VVTLNGEVDEVHLVSLAERCAAAIPGVRGILNYIRTTGFDRNAEDLRFLQPVINTQIYFQDGPSGTVQQVVIDPNNRLVSGVLIQGRFSNSPKSSRSTIDGGTSSSKQIVIPAREIRYLTKRSGFLKIRSFDTERYDDFVAQDFISPEKNWIPPFPYHLENVLLPAEH
jgi:sporulation protein YlmC with PRC-barrel domain